MVQYVAMTDGYVGTHYVRAGELFEMEGAAPRWARRVSAAEAASKVSAADAASASGARDAGLKVSAAKPPRKGRAAGAAVERLRAHDISAAADADTREG